MFNTMSDLEQGTHSLLTKKFLNSTKTGCCLYDFTFMLVNQGMNNY